MKLTHKRVYFYFKKEIKIGAPLDDSTNASTVLNESENSNNEANNSDTNNQATTPVTVLGNLINDVTETNTRFQPHLQEYQNLMMNDSSVPVLDDNEIRKQRFCNNVNDMMHLMCHLFHNLSDLHINLREASPRNIRTMIPFQTATVISTIPSEFMPSAASAAAASVPPVSATTTTTNAQNFMESLTRLNPTTHSTTTTSRIENNTNNIPQSLHNLHAQQHLHNIHTHHMNIMRLPFVIQTTAEISQINPPPPNPNPTEQQQQPFPNRATNNNSVPQPPQPNRLHYQSSQSSGDPYLLCQSVSIFKFAKFKWTPRPANNSSKI